MGVGESADSCHPSLRFSSIGTHTVASDFFFFFIIYTAATIGCRSDNKTYRFWSDSFHICGSTLSERPRVSFYCFFCSLKKKRVKFAIPCDKASTAVLRRVLGGLTGRWAYAGLETDLSPLIQLGSDERSFSAALVVEGNLGIAGLQRFK